MDDNSKDDTIVKLTDYLNNNTFMKQRTSVVVTSYNRGALYNRHFANLNFC